MGAATVNVDFKDEITRLDTCMGYILLLFQSVHKDALNLVLLPVLVLFTAILHVYEKYKSKTRKDMVSLN